MEFEISKFKLSYNAISYCIENAKLGIALTTNSVCLLQSVILVCYAIIYLGAYIIRVVDVLVERLVTGLIANQTTALPILVFLEPNATI